MTSGFGYSQRSRLDKLGVKEGMRVAALRLDDTQFLQELSRRTDDIVQRRPRKDTDLIFLLAMGPQDLRRLSRLRSTIKPNGAIWVLWRKGRLELKQQDVMAAAKASGLVDIKVASFSEELSALKLVIPVAARP
jgi:hypothetical protein